MSPDRLRLTAAAMLAAAAGIHIAATPVHLEVSPVHGGAFIFLAVAQAAAAGALVAGGTAARLIRVPAAIGSLVVVALWAVSRLVDVAGLGREPAGIADTTATILEGGAAIILLGALSGARMRDARARLVPATVVLAVFALALAGATAAPIVHVAHGAGAGHEPHPYAAGDHAPHTDGSSAHDPHEGGEGVQLHGLGTASTARGALRANAPAEGRVFGIGGEPSGVASGLGSIWVIDRASGTITRIDPRTGSVAASQVAVGPSAVATGHGSVWVTDFTRDELIRIDPRTLRVTATVPVAVGPSALASSPEGIIVTGVTDSIVQRIDPRELEVVAQAPIGYGASAVLPLDGSLWVTLTLDRTVVEIDGRTLRARGAPVAVPAGPVGITHSAGKLYVASASAGTLTAIDPSTRRVVGTPLVLDRLAAPGRGPIAVAAAGDGVWVANNREKSLRGYDPATDLAGEARSFGGELDDHAVAVHATEGYGAVWVTDAGAGTVVRMEVTR